MAWLLVGLYVAVASVYLVWRGGTLNPDAPVFSGLVYGAELFGFATTLVHLFMVHRLTVRSTPPPPDGWSVDILVPTYNESADIVRRTLLAAQNVDYPHETWLLDDGNRAEMRALASELGVRYLARTDNRHAKAGNLNHALRHTTGEFIAIFDADHAPKRNFLHETLGYFRDPLTAFVQTPQDFFNLDSYQHRANEKRGRVWTEQSLFFRVIQRGKDRWNAAFFCGSCAVIRRSALDRIGGFACRTITEDLETSVALHRAGFRSVYVDTPLAFGLAPSSAKPFLTQRIRWGQGAMQVLRREAFFSRPGLTTAQRLNYLASTTTYFDGWQKAIFYVAPAWVLITGSMPLIADSTEFLLLFLPYFLLTFLVFEEVGRGYGRASLIEQYNMARFAAFMWATLGLFRRRLRFRVTGKERLTAAQQEAQAVSPQIAVGVLNIVAIIAGAVLWMSARHLPLDGLIANIVWASVNFGMAAAVVRFTVGRARFRRRDYRFPLALPAVVEVGGERAIMTVDDISSSGCRLYGAFPEGTAPGDTLRGTLHVPGQPLAFVARVAALIPSGRAAGTYSKALGIEFEWPSTRERDALDLFLYGSDLQWVIQRMHERVPTPTERITTRRTGEHAAIGGAAHWTAVEVLHDGHVAELALIAGGPGGTRLLATDHRLSSHRTIVIRECGRRGGSRSLVQPEREVARADTPVGAIYLTEVRAC